MIFNALFYDFTALIFIVSLVLYRKTNEKQNLVFWIIISIVFLMTFQGCTAAILAIFKFKIYPLLISIINLLFSLIIMYNIFKSKKIQKYSISFRDIISVIIIVTITAYICLKNNTLNLFISYIEADPAVHFRVARNILETGKIDGMFYAHLNNSLLLNGFSFLAKNSFSYYKIYILIDLFMYMLSGLIFYALLSKIRNTFRNNILIYMSIVVYMLGYPLTNLLFGFNYLGVAVTLIVYIIILCILYKENSINRKVLLFAISLSCMGLSLCYMLFAPAVWFAVAIILLSNNENNNLFSKNNLFLLLLVFLVPFIIAIKYCYFDFFVNAKLSFSKQLATNGGFYGNYITNFLIFIPPAFYFIFRDFKNKNISVLTIFSLDMFAFFTYCIYFQEIWHYV
jgi:hypothetical protein